MQFPIAPKPVTITNDTAQEREYYKSDTVQITAVTLEALSQVTPSPCPYPQAV